MKRRLAVLTPRHMEIAALVAKGMEDKEIARALGLTPQTTRNHLQEIFRRLEIDNRTKLAVLYLREGPPVQLRLGA